MLYYDIETAPELNYEWGSGKWDTRPLKVVKPRYLLSVVYMWEGSDETHWVSLDQNPKFKPDHWYSKQRDNIDDWVTGELWNLFNIADITIAHNGKRFDTKRTNARYIIRNVQPYNEPAQIDTLLEYRKYAAFTSNRLAELARELGLEGKYHHPGLDMWWGCMEGDPEMWGEMETYNRQDVVTLREVFMKIQPWTVPVMNVAAFDSLDGRPLVCPSPGCQNPKKGLISRGPRTRASGLKYDRWQCKGCGRISTSRYARRENYKPLVK